MAKTRLTAVPTLLRDAGFQPPSYRHLRDAAVDGKIPARQINSIWHADPRDLHAIAMALELDRVAAHAEAA